MLLNTHVIKFISLTICAILLSQCTKATEAPVAEPIKVAQPLVSPYTMPATAYLTLAKNKTDGERQSLLIMAAGRLIYDGQWREGRTILSQTNDVTADLANEKRVLLAKIDLIREQPHAAIAKLATVNDVHHLPIYYQVQFHEILANAYQAVANANDSVSERIKLERLLPDEASKTNNHRALWLTLTMLPESELNTLAVEATKGTELEGWMQLALISHQHDDNAQKMIAQIEQWQAHYPAHPGNDILPSPLASVSSNLFASPKQVALLLPLTGPLSGPGGAVKEGFMAGLHASHAPDSVNVRLYNTDANNVESLYQQAVAEGADYIVGPLSKVNVTTIATIDHPVPTLLLNEVGVRPNDRGYQFGLSPSNEARQVATKIRKSGFTRALVIGPAGEWGGEVISAFTRQWRADGGHIIDTLLYRSNDDLNVSMRDFLHVSASEVRQKQLKQLIGQNVESITSRRQDFDVIFLLAYPSKARQIMPLLKYYYAGDVPVYATSEVYAGGVNVMKDKDLDGITFCDMPWVFAHQMGNKSWPEQFNSYNRLYALGMESYALSTKLNQLLVFPSARVNGKRGVLSLTPSQQITRRLAWGQFKKGLALQVNDSLL